MSIYQFKVETVTGEVVSLEKYKGKVLLIVNTATGCGFTPQYEGLQQLYNTYHDKGFEILDFPCNQFKNQAPESNAEINQFCQLNYNTTFDRFAKIDVNGHQAHPLYKWLKEEKKGLLGKTIEWNFTKFLVDKQGNVVKRFSPKKNPVDIAKDIEFYL